MNSLTDLLEDLKKGFKGKFLIPRQVKYETIDRPLQIKKFELAALKNNELIDEKILELPDILGIDEEELKEKTQEILRISNNAFFARDEFMHIIDEGEAGCMALSLILSKKGIDNVIVIDERTTRMLGENPGNLRKLFESKLHTKVELKQDFSFLSKIKFIRSSELVYIAYKKGLVKLKNGNVLDALLYATKFKGAAISIQEIEEIKKLN
jgi:hypothetical protein